jgi:hypothetical protein
MKRETDTEYAARIKEELGWTPRLGKSFYGENIPMPWSLIDMLCHLNLREDGIGGR